MGIDAEMFIRTTNNITFEELKKYSYIFGSAFRSQLFLGFKENIYHRPLEFIDKWEQGGSDILPSPNEQFIKVPLAGQYYGPGYERGDLLGYISIAEFLEHLILNCEVWYGGDSGGVYAEPFTKKVRESLIKYYIENNGRDNYVRTFDDAPDKLSTNPVCPVCDVKMFRNGWGMSYSLHTCGGCGWTVTFKDGVTTQGF